MSDEFRKIKSTGETRFVLEFSDAGVSSSVNIASIEKPLGELQRRAEPPKPRNFVAKNAKMGGAGQHKDKKKAEKQGDTKHKNKSFDMAEGKEDKIAQLKKDHATAVHWSQNERSPQKREAARRKAETIKAHLEKQYKQGVAEGFNGEYDDEAGMAQSNLLTTARAVMGLLKTIKDRDNLPEWGQEKIAKAEMMLVSVWDYLQSQKQMGNDPQVDMEEGYQHGLPDPNAPQLGGRRNRDPEDHHLDVPRQDPREFRMYNLTIDGKPLNPQPIMGRSNLIKFGKQQAAAGVDLSNAMISLVDENVAEGNEDRSRFIRFNIWTVMDGDEEVMQHPVEGDPFFSAKKFMRQLDDEGYEFTHVISPKGEITYLPQFDPRNFPKDEVDEQGVDTYMESLTAKLANKLK